MPLEHLSKPSASERLPAGERTAQGQECQMNGRLPFVAHREAAVAVEPRQRPLDGLITNDTFCFVRFAILPLSWWRRPLRMRTLSLQSRGAIHAGGTDETRLEHPSPLHSKARQPDPLGSGVSAPPALDDPTSGSSNTSRSPTGGL